MVVSVIDSNLDKPTLREIDHGDLPLDDHIERFVKNKIKTLVMHLISLHIENGGQYYESHGENLNNVVECDAPPRVIANTITPYLLWVTNQYMVRFYGRNLDFFKFLKKESITIPHFFNLDYQINRSGSENISIVFLFLSCAFQDKFASTEKKKLSINLLPLLIRNDFEVMP